MTIHQRAAALLIAAALTPRVEAQTPAAPGPAGAQRLATAAELRERYYRGLPTDPRSPDYHEAAASSVLRYRPIQRQAPAARESDGRYDRRDDGGAGRDETYGFRNPGGIGRRAEYYPPGNRFQNSGDPVRAAGHDTGVGPDRADQLAARSVGTERYNAVQRSIDTRARPVLPFFGFGGYGGYGGFGGPIVP